MDTYTEGAIEQARERGFLFIPAAAQLTVFQYKKEQSRLNLPAICLLANERHTEVTFYLCGLSLTDAGKVKIAERALLSISPGGMVLINDRRLIASRLTFDAGMNFARWLVLQLSSPANIKIGQFSERNHMKIQADKRLDSSLVFRAGKDQMSRQERFAA